MKKVLLIITLLLLLSPLYSRQITLQNCIDEAVKQSPIIGQKLLYDNASELEIKNLRSVYLPQFSIDGSGTYQSDIFTLPISFPGISIPSIPKGQFQAAININQTIYDGGFSTSSIDKEEADTKTGNQAVEVNLFKVKDAVTQIYFSVLLMQDNEKVLQTTLSELQNRERQLNAMQKNGVILSSDIDAIRIEILKTTQALTSLKADKKASLISLGKWINSDITNETLEIPATSIETTSQPTQRPEYVLFDLEKEQMEAGKNVIFSQLVPKLSAYVRGGYAKPNPFNMFATNVESFYIAGIKLQWTPFDWNTNNRRRESLEISKSVIETEKLNFDKTLDISLVKDRSDEAKYADMSTSDKEIIELQTKIAETTFDRLKNGTATSTDYITQQNNLTQVRINGDLHRLQSIYAKINLLLKSGKL